MENANRKFVTISFNNGIMSRPFMSGDKAGTAHVDGMDGCMHVHGSERLAYEAMSKYWKVRGYKPENALHSRMEAPASERVLPTPRGPKMWKDGHVIN